MHNYIFIKVIKLHVYMPFPHALISINEDIFLNSVFGRGAKWVVIMLIEPLLSCISGVGSNLDVGRTTKSL
jgi:hypothetical protein